MLLADLSLPDAAISCTVPALWPLLPVVSDSPLLCLAVFNSSHQQTDLTLQVGRRSRLAVESVPRRLATTPTRSWLSAFWALACYLALLVALLTAAWLAQHYSTLLQQHSSQSAGGCMPLQPALPLGSSVGVRGRAHSTAAAAPRSAAMGDTDLCSLRWHVSAGLQVSLLRTHTPPGQQVGGCPRR